MSNTRSSSGKLSIFVTRRWPQAAEVALGEHFDVTLNDGDKPLLRDALIDGFASHDIAAPTVSDKIDAQIVAAGAVWQMSPDRQLWCRRKSHRSGGRGGA